MQTRSPDFGGRVACAHVQSVRRRTQREDFESLEVVFPADMAVQNDLVRAIFEARHGQSSAAEILKTSMMAFSDVIDGRFGEELPETSVDEVAVEE